MNQRPPRYLVITVHTQKSSTSTVHLQLYTFYAEHRDIAYELALQFGRETCFGREFCGLAYLGVTEERIVRKWKLEDGEADEFVLPKNRLEAYSARWFTRPCNPTLLYERTAEPTFQMELDCLDRVPWYELEHAYGNAFDIPKEIRRLTSTEDIVQSGAIERLYGTIYHQGSIFSSTAASIDPLLQIVANTSIRNRGRIAELLVAITESAMVGPERIKEKWTQLAKLGYPQEDHSDREIQARKDVRDEIESHYSRLCDLALDCDHLVAEKFRSVIELISRTTKR